MIRPIQAYFIFMDETRDFLSRFSSVYDLASAGAPKKLNDIHNFIEFLSSPYFI